jgi:hypothetical protein
MALALLVGITAYLVIVDYGINAGRIHHGVDVQGVDVGGLTREEAYSVLSDRGLDLEDGVVLLTIEGTDCHFVPQDDLGWDSRPFETATAAYRIGRGESWIAAVGARAKAWFAGVTVPWLDEPDPDRMSAFLDFCEGRVTAVGYEVRRHRLREKIRAAITRWPRVPVTIPVVGS